MSIKKIAELAGVSPATVSRVLNNPDYKCASAGLRDKIWRIAMELNYVPNEAARILKKGENTKNKTYYLYVLMTRMDDLQEDPFFGELLHSIETNIHGQMCVLSKVWYLSAFSDDRRCRYMDLDRVVEDMYGETKGKCDGLIIIGKCCREALKKLHRKFKNVVSVNRNSTNYEVDEVVCDGRKVAAIALEYLAGLGHQKIGYVGQCHNEARYRGFLDVLQEHNIDVDPRFILETKQTEEAGFKAMKHFLSMEERPTGIYCANDITAIGMIGCLNRYKDHIYMPSIVASDDIEAAQNIKPMLTTVRLPKEEMGKFALDLLLDRLRGGHKGVIRVEVSGKLMVRNSCAAPEECVWNDYCI